MIQVEAAVHAAVMVIPHAMAAYCVYWVITRLITKMIKPKKRKLTKDLWCNKNGVKIKSNVSGMTREDIDWLEENMK